LPRKQKRSNTSLGKLGEKYAELLLQEKGYKVIDRNVRSRFGEIDLIAIDKDTLVFVEVKTRWSSRFGSPEEAVTPKKLQKIKRTAEYFSLTQPKLPKKLRIDVVAIEIENSKVVRAKIIKVDD